MSVSGFNDAVDQVLAHKAVTKGYDGREGGLFQLCKSLPHPLGEMIYKVVRYHKQGNPDDLVKIAGWARLIWEEYHADREGSSGRDASSQIDTRSTLQGPRQSFIDLGERDAGGDSGSSGRGAFTEAVRRAAVSDICSAVGVSPSGGRRKSLGNKHRPRKGKGRT